MFLDSSRSGNGSYGGGGGNGNYANVGANTQDDDLPF